MTKKILSTNRGVPVVDNRNSLAAGQRGPVLTKEIHIIEKQEMTL